MANQFLRKRPNRLLTGRNNYFWPGGPTNSASSTVQNFMNQIHGYRGNQVQTQALVDYMNNNGIDVAKNPNGTYKSASLSAANGQGVKAGGLNMNQIAGLATIGGTSIYNIINGIQSSDIDSALSNFQNRLDTTYSGPVTNDSYDQLAQDWLNNRHIKETTAKDFGAVGTGQMLGNFAKNAASGAIAGSSFGGVGALIGGAVQGISSLIGDASRSGKARTASAKANAAIAERNSFNDRSLVNRGTNLNATLALESLANIAAQGGQLNNIHGGYFSNNLSFINNGGLHETNPYQGVPMGIDQEGTPNLVEEGEVLYKDYVYSNRLKVGGDLNRKYKLGSKKKPLTFAEAITKLGKESEERPNDPISMNGLNAFASDLAQAQEELKAKASLKYGNGNRRMAAYGGNLFDGGGVVDLIPESYVGLRRLFSNPDPYLDFMKNGAFKDSELAKGLAPIFANKDYNLANFDFSGDKLPKKFDKFLKDEKQAAELDQLIRNYGYQVNGLATPWSKYLDVLTPEDRVAIANNFNKLWEQYRTDPESNSEFKDIADQFGMLAGGINKDNIPIDFMQALLNKDNWDLPMQLTAGNLLRGTSVEDMIWPVDEPKAAEVAEVVEQQKSQEELQKDIVEGITGAEKNVKEDTQEGFPIQDTIVLGRTPDKPSAPEVKPSPFGKDHIGIEANDETQKLLDDAGIKYTKYGNYLFMSLNDAVAHNVYNVIDFDKKGTLTEGTELYGRKQLPPKLKSPVNKLEAFSIFGPAFGALWGAFNDKTDEDLYKSSLDAARNAGKVLPIRYKGVGDYVIPEKFPLDYAAVQARNAANASNRQAVNTSGGNRATAAANLLANEYNAQRNWGDTLLQAFKDDNERYLKGSEFNRTTNTTNAEGDLRAAQSNQSAYSNSGDAYVRAVANANSIKQAARLQRDQAMSANLTGLFQNIGNYGRQQTGYAMMQHLIDDLGIAPGYTFSIDKDNGLSVKMTAYGGKINKRKRRKGGLTY